MKFISLTRGYVTVVDDADFLEVGDLKWQAKVCPDGRVYASRGVVIVPGGKQKTIRLHQVLMGSLTKWVDHKDGNGLNNQRNNLRFCTHRENMQNSRKHKGCESRWKGVYRRKSRKFFEAYISIPSKSRKFLGCFKSELEAADAYDFAARKFHGEFANLNFPIERENTSGS